MNKMIMKAMLRLSKHREDGRIPTKLYILLDTKRTLTQLNISGLGTPRSDCSPEKTVRSIRAAFMHRSYCQPMGNNYSGRTSASVEEIITVASKKPENFYSYIFTIP